MPSGPPGGALLTRRRATTVGEQIRSGAAQQGPHGEETPDFLAECGLRVKKTNPRQYATILPCRTCCAVSARGHSAASRATRTGITARRATEALNGGADSVVSTTRSATASARWSWPCREWGRTLPTWHAGAKAWRVATGTATPSGASWQRPGRRAPVLADGVNPPHHRLRRLHRGHHQHRHHAAREPSAPLDDGVLVYPRRC